MNQIKRVQNEVWYNSNVWSIIDNAFDNVEEINPVRGESSTIAGSIRKNRSRLIGSTEAMQRSAIRAKCDLIFRETNANHEAILEYGVGEAGTKAQGTKQIVEAGVKLPNILKDMLDQLIIKSNNQFEHLRVYGIQHSGLSMTSM